MNDSIRFLKNKNLLLLCLGEFASQAGTRMYQIAISWWLINLQDAAAGLRMGLFLLVSSLPALVGVKWIGRLVENSDRKRLLLATNLIAFLIVLAIVLLYRINQLSLLPIYLAGIALAFLQAIVDPALQKSIGELATPCEMDGAVAGLTSTVTLASFFGAILGAGAFSALGLQGCIFLNGLSYMIAILAILGVRWSKSNAESTSENTALLTEASAEASSDWKLLDFIRSQGSLGRLMIGFGFINFFSTPTLVVIPLFVKKVLMKEADTLAGVEAGLWLGFVLGGFSAAGFKRVRSVLAGNIALLMMGVALFLGVITQSAWSYGGCLFLVGVSCGFANVKFIAHFQEKVQESEKGRFFAILNAVSSGMLPIAFFFFGWLADLISLSLIIGIQGTGVMILAATMLGLEAKAATRSVVNSVRSLV